MGGALGSHLWTDLALAIVTVWAVNWIENPTLSASLCNSAIQIKLNKFERHHETEGTKMRMAPLPVSLWHSHGSSISLCLVYFETQQHHMGIAEVWGR